MISNLKYYLLLIVAPALFIGCGKLESGKDSDPHPTDTTAIKSAYKIEVLSGKNQTDTVGHRLKDQITVKVYKDGKPFGNSTVEFAGSGCTGEYADHSFTVTTGPDIGLNIYDWFLSADAGEQTLKIVLCDLQNKRLDSVSITANSILPSGKGILKSACSFGNVNKTEKVFYKLNSGRIFADFAETTRYSDDNGLSWHPIKTLKNSRIRQMAITPDDRIFALVSGGLIFSVDKGLTWKVLVPDNPDAISLVDVTYTRSGKLFYSGGSEGYINISADNGATWKKIRMPVVNGYFGLTEQTNGDLYVLSIDGGLFKSTDDGTSWTLLNYASKGDPYYTAIFINQDGNIYLSQAYSTAGIYVSGDNMKTVKKVSFSSYNFDNLFVADRISKQSDGYYYIHTVTEGIFRTKDFAHIENINKRYNITTMDCIVANNGGLIIEYGEVNGLSYIPN